jgi:hypothetical protein
MTHLPNLTRTSSLLLAVSLGACNPENPITSETESGTDTGTSTEGDPSGDPTGTPSPTTTDDTTTTPTTTPTTGDTTGPTDPTTGPTTTDPTTETQGETDSTSTGEPIDPQSVWATANPTGLSADAVVGLTSALDMVTATQTLLGDVISIQSVAYLNNDAVISYDAPGGVGGVLIIDNLPNNLMAAPIGLGTRIITGPTTGLVAPKGVEAAGPDGLILVADTGAPGIHAFLAGDKGDVAPQFTVTDIGAAEGVWDIHFDDDNDTLYAAGTNGQVLVYEDFTAMQGQAGPTRTITPTENDSQVSVNLHGVTVNDTKLYLTDVGDPMDNADGQIFVIDDVANADGDVPVLQRIQGDALGNPVDLELRPSIASSTLFVAEKANDKLLVYREDVVTKELAPGGTLDVTKPESVALRTGTTLLLSQNDAGVDTDGLLLVNTPMIGDPTAGAALTQIGSISSVQSLALALDGRGYVGFDGPAVSGGGGVFIVDGLTDLAGEGQIDTLVSRLWGPETGIVTPKGIALNQAQDRLFVADTAANNIKVFDTANLGNTEPLFVFDDLGTDAPVWDIAYDDAEDRLFAAGVDGVVRVFDTALASQGNDAPARLITPTDGADQISVNLHGIHYDAASKILILSDVGDPMDPADGAVFLIPDADTADDQVMVSAAIRGDATRLGNPVDIAFDGTNLFIAEKSNSAVLRYDAILDFTGLDNNVAESSMIEVANAESVQVFTKP